MPDGPDLQRQRTMHLHVADDALRKRLRQRAERQQQLRRLRPRVHDERPERGVRQLQRQRDVCNYVQLGLRPLQWGVRQRAKRQRQLRRVR